MRCFLLQDFITIRGASTVTSVIQSEPAWLDLGALQDVVVWLDVKEVSPGSPTNVQISYETSPTSDDALFVAMSGPTTISAPGLTVTKLLMASLTNPLGRLFRWKLGMSGTAATWDITFRILLCANAPGPWRGATAMAALPTGPLPAPVSTFDGTRPSLPDHVTKGSPFGNPPTYPSPAGAPNSVISRLPPKPPPPSPFSA